MKSFLPRCSGRANLIIAAPALTLLLFFSLSLVAKLPGAISQYSTISQHVLSREVNIPTSDNITHRIPPDPRVKCIKVAYGLSMEGIGANIKRTQIALFLASWHNVPIQYPVKLSTHGYAIHEQFGLCPGEKHPETTPKFPEDQPCAIYASNVILNFCPRGDCQCLYSRLQPFVKPLLEGGCSVITYKSAGPKTLQFSGCLRNVLEKYFVGNTPRPAWQYDAIHYRMGDLADNPGGKSFSLLHLNYLVQAMCQHSDRDIVVVTEGEPPMPKCENRLILAGNTTIKEAFQIMRYARHVAVGPSSFAIAMMEVARPERVFMTQGTVRMYEWVNAENWTIVANKGETIINYDSKKLMLDNVFTRDLTDLTRLSSSSRATDDDVILQVPDRKWSKEMMKA